MSIAVIVPNRNDVRYVRRCLRSLIDQDVRPDELIVVDDQSTDDSVRVIGEAIAGRPWAKLLVNPVNLGTNGALNEGLKHSRSEYVLFLASNDFVLPGIFARAKDCLARWPGAGLWSAMAWLVDEHDRPIRLHPSPVVSLRDAWFPPERCRSLAYRFGNWFTGCTMMYRREVLEAVGGFDPFYEGLSDLITALIVCSRSGAAYSPRPFAGLRVHGGSHLSRTLRDPAALDARLERLRRRGPELAPQLFTEAFLDRTRRRFRFAALRSRAADDSAGSVRVAIAFLRLRPFDLLPTLWNRFLGWVVVRLRNPWPFSAGS